MLFTNEHNAIRSTIAQFIDKEINPYVDEWERDAIFPTHEVFKKMGDLGLLGIHKPTEYGGMGLDYSYQIVFSEELGRVRCGAAPMAIGVQTDMVTPTLARFGCDELCREFLAPSITGEAVFSIGVSEPHAGSDVAASTLKGMENNINDTIEYARERQAFGKSILDNQVVHFRLAELQTEVELLRALVYDGVEGYINGQDVTLKASMAKLKSGRLAREVADSCLQYWGVWATCGITQ